MLLMMLLSSAVQAPVLNPFDLLLNVDKVQLLLLCFAVFIIVCRL